MAQLKMAHNVFPRPMDRDEFDVAIICASPLESDAVEALFDQFWEDIDHQLEKISGDINSYTLGRIGRHNVVLVHLSGVGKVRSASAAACLKITFPRIRLGLIVGICGGVPQSPGNSKEVLLGDVIISTGVVQIDFVRQFDNEAIRKNTPQDNLGRPSIEIRAFLAQIQGGRARSILKQRMAEETMAISQMEKFKHWHFPGRDFDHLYETGYCHKHQIPSQCPVCTQVVDQKDAICDAARGASCEELGCDKTRLVVRQRRDGQPIVHFGNVASADMVMHSAAHRDRIAQTEKVLGFEMSAAGVWDHCPTVVIKGVSNYADSHEHDRWESYAALTAAACAKAFLREWRGVERPSSISIVKHMVAPAPAYGFGDD